MKNLAKYLSAITLLAMLTACSDPMNELANDIESPRSNTPGTTFNVIPGSITQTIGTGQNACTEYYVYAIASGGTTVSYDRRARITIIKDAYTDSSTGIPVQASIIDQYVLTIPAGSSVSPNQRVLMNAQEEYDHDFTYSVEEFTDTMGNDLPNAVLWDRTYKISGNCYTDPGNGGWSMDIKGCFSGKIACDLNGNGIIDG